MFQWIKTLSRRMLDRDSFGGAFSTLAGQARAPLSELNCMGIPAVSCAVTTIAEEISCLDLPVYKRVPRGKQKAPNHRNQKLLDNPNRWMTKNTWKELAVHHLLLWGNSVNEIAESPMGDRELIPILPNRVEYLRHGNGDPYYQIAMSPGVKPVILEANEVLHIKSKSYDGIVGIGPVQDAARNFEIARAQEEFAAAFYKNAATPAMAFKYPGRLKDDARENLRTSIRLLHEGAHNAARSILLEEGLDVTPLTMPLESAQFLASRQFSVIEIARMFKINPVFLMDMGTPFASHNLEQLDYMLLKHTLRPLLHKMQEEINQKLFDDDERDEYFVRFDTSSYHQADIATMQTVAASRLQNGQTCVNEWREENGYPVIDERGDVFRVQLNMANAQPDQPDNQNQGTPEPNDEDEPDDTTAGE